MLTKGYICIKQCSYIRKNSEQSSINGKDRFCLVKKKHILINAAMNMMGFFCSKQVACIHRCSYIDKKESEHREITLETIEFAYSTKAKMY